MDERFAGRNNRFAFLLVQDDTKPVDLPGGRSAAGLLMNTLARIDLETRQHDCFWVGPRSSLQEPVFARRPGSHREGDGYLILVENRLADMQSRLLILDAQRLSQGPVATCDIPFRLRPGLHGNWYEDRGPTR
jgi:carotenoid cleavage dioxygenase